MKSEQDDKLDDLLRSKLTRKDFVMKDEYWQNARRMVDESWPRPPKPRKYAMLLIAGIMVALVSVATINYSVSKKRSALKEQGEQQQEELVADQPAGQMREAEKVQGAQLLSQPKPAGKEADPTRLVLAASHEPVGIAGKEEKKAEARVAASRNKNVPAVAHLPANGAGKDAATIHHARKNTGAVKATDKTNTLEPRKRGSSTTLASTAEIPVVNNNDPEPAMITMPNTTSSMSATGKHNKPVIPGDRTTAPVVAQTEPAASVLVAATQQQGDLQSMEGMTRELPAGESQDATAVVQNKPLPSELIDISKTNNMSLYAYQVPVKHEAYRPVRKSNGFKSIEVGATLYNPSKDLLDNFNYHLAARYGFHVGRKTDMSIGIGYSRLHQSKGTRTYNVISYDLGEHIQTNGVNTVRLDYVDLPVTFYYALHGRHGLAGGATFSYLVHSADLLKKPEQTDYNIKANGYFGAFTPFDVQLHLGYTYMFSSKIMLSATYNYGVVDITRNKVFRSGAYNNNAGARITIGYQLH